MLYAPNNIWNLLWVAWAFLFWNLQNSQKNITTWFHSSETMLTYASKISQFICFLLFHHIPTFLKGLFLYLGYLSPSQEVLLYKGRGFFYIKRSAGWFLSLFAAITSPCSHRNKKTTMGMDYRMHFLQNLIITVKHWHILLSAYKSLFSVEITAYYLSHLNILLHTSEQHNKGTCPD